MASPLRHKLFEFRHYQIATEHFGSFVQLTKEKIHMRTAHSPLLGYWQIEAGLLNSVCHIWHFDSFEHRARVRAALAADPEWNETYLNKCKPWWVSQKNSFMQIFEDAKTDVVPEGLASPGLYAIDVGPVSRGLTNHSSKLFTWRVVAGDLPVRSVLSLSRITAPDGITHTPEPHHSEVENEKYSSSRMIVSALPFSTLR
jgi:hypothetical protein